MNKKVKNTLKYLLFFSIAAGLLILTYYQIDLKDMMEAISEANFWWLGLSVVLGYVAIVARGLRWRSLLEPMGYHAKPMNRINAVNFGYLANLGIPRSGEVARCTALNQTDDIPVDKLFGTVLIERVIDLLLLLMMIGITFLIHYDAFSAFFEGAFTTKETIGSADKGFPWLLVLAGFGLFCFLVVIFMRKTLEKISIFKKGYAFLDGMKDGFKSILKLKRFWEFIGYSLLIWLSYFLMTYVCFWSLGFMNHFTPADAMLLFVVGGLAMIVPAPGGAGSYQYAVSIAVVAIITINVGGADFMTEEMRVETKKDGVAFATLVWSAQTLMLIVTGIMSMIMLMLVRRKKDKAALNA